MFVNMPACCAEFSVEDLRQRARVNDDALVAWAADEIERLSDENKDLVYAFRGQIGAARPFTPEQPATVRTAFQRARSA